jgi:hypothetical protein
MKYQRMIMEAESPDLAGPQTFLYNLAESTVITTAILSCAL